MVFLENLHTLLQLLSKVLGPILESFELHSFDL
jgi:hypothetical protein